MQPLRPCDKNRRPWSSGLTAVLQTIVVTDIRQGLLCTHRREAIVTRKGWSSFEGTPTSPAGCTLPAKVIDSVTHALPELKRQGIPVAYCGTVMVSSQYASLRGEFIDVWGASRLSISRCVARLLVDASAGY